MDNLTKAMDLLDIPAENRNLKGLVIFALQSELTLSAEVGYSESSIERQDMLQNMIQELQAN